VPGYDRTVPPGREYILLAEALIELALWGSPWAFMAFQAGPFRPRKFPSPKVQFCAGLGREGAYRRDGISAGGASYGLKGQQNIVSFYRA
jgi:hypothetical protein